MLFVPRLYSWCHREGDEYSLGLTEGVVLDPGLDHLGLTVERCAARLGDRIDQEQAHPPGDVAGGLYRVVDGVVHVRRHPHHEGVGAVRLLGDLQAVALAQSAEVQVLDLAFGDRERDLCGDVLAFQGELLDGGVTAGHHADLGDLLQHVLADSLREGRGVVGLVVGQAEGVLDAGAHPRVVNGALDFLVDGESPVLRLAGELGDGRLVGVVETARRPVQVDVDVVFCLRPERSQRLACSYVQAALVLADIDGSPHLALPFGVWLKSQASSVRPENYIMNLLKMLQTGKRSFDATQSCFVAQNVHGVSQPGACWCLGGGNADQAK